MRKQQARRFRCRMLLLSLLLLVLVAVSLTAGVTGLSHQDILRILKKEIRLYPYSKNDMSSFLYQELGLTPDPMVVEYDNADNLAISMETLPDLSAQHIILIAGYGSQTAEAVEAAKQRYDEIKADPLWQMVPAVQSGSVYEVDSRVWLTHGLLATEEKIDEVLDFLA